MTNPSASNASLYQENARLSMMPRGESADLPRPLVDVLSEVTLAGGRRATVARFASRFFVLLSERGAPRSRADVRGPYETAQEATRRARILQHRICAEAEHA